MKPIMHAMAVALLSLLVVEPTHSAGEESVFIEFEREAHGTFLGTTTVFVRVKDGYKCKASQGFFGQKKLATLDKGNPLVSSKNEHGVAEAPSDQFRVLIRTIGGNRRCDVVASFSAKSGERYKLTSRSDFPTIGDQSCSADVSVMQDGAFKKMEFSEYSECR
ncbi:MAG TPA: hypothetical protein VJS12_12735 [Steroidobacteraceae bacterium]|nr:hypothetical protein [Steroidobacteraceae bacterium]